MRLALTLAALLTPAFLAGCSSGKAPTETATAQTNGSQPAGPAEATPAQEPARETVTPPAAGGAEAITAQQLEAALRQKNPNFKGEVFTQLGPQGIAVVGINDPALEDISPLAGLPLFTLDLHDSHVTDLRALEGMQLRRVDLSNTGVSDASVLSGMPLEMAFFNKTGVKAAPTLEGAALEVLDFSDTPLEDIGGLRGAAIGELYLVNTKLKDIEALRGGRIQSIWLNNTPLQDCSPLASAPVVSVTLAGTKVSDIGCFKGHPTLQRLHIGETEVTDLTPVQWMDGLTRLIFTPQRIKTGMEDARRIPSIQEIGTAFGTPDDEGKMYSPDVFWKMYDEGKFK
ncbi:MAG: leucine-rich repeat domain-containing protein [Thermoguttaceae bacterium]